VKKWRNRPLEAVYPIVYLEALVVKVRSEAAVSNHAVYVALGVNLEGHKEVLYLCIQRASKKWTMPIQNWGPALERFKIEFGERVPDINRINLYPRS
jgi:transposase-like protein